ncbi:MAG: hypothetical protein FD167_2897, partial [bacterium]
MPTQQDFETVINRFQSRISAPMLTNLAIDWGQMQVSDFYPNPVPDLYINQPVFITGKFKATGTREQVFIKALSAIGLSSLPVVIDTAANNIRFRAISSLWARAKAEQLSNKLIETPNNPAIKQEITNLGLKHKLLTQFTSFIALEEKTIIPKEGGKPQTIKVPVPLPDGWNGVGEEDVMQVDEEELQRGLYRFSAQGADKNNSIQSLPIVSAPTAEKKASAAKGLERAGTDTSRADTGHKIGASGINRLPTVESPARRSESAPIPMSTQPAAPEPSKQGD